LAAATSMATWKAEELCAKMRGCKAAPPVATGVSTTNGALGQVPPLVVYVTVQKSPAAIAPEPVVTVMVPRWSLPATETVGEVPAATPPAIAGVPANWVASLVCSLMTPVPWARMLMLMLAFDPPTEYQISEVEKGPM
jgi:hypothetical protein